MATFSGSAASGGPTPSLTLALHDRCRPHATSRRPYQRTTVCVSHTGNLWQASNNPNIVCHNLAIISLWPLPQTDASPAPRGADNESCWPRQRRLVTVMDVVQAAAALASSISDEHASRIAKRGALAIIEALPTVHAAVQVMTQSEILQGVAASRDDELTSNDRSSILKFVRASDLVAGADVKAMVMVARRAAIGMAVNAAADDDARLELARGLLNALVEQGARIAYHVITCHLPLTA